ncbi:MAG: flavoprotein [Nanohaloarchaea archaeon SW_7_43_1]|nr:MAG: flavoprotein [Nanohaloarchaea archaeon SW_7_43_1]
MKLTNLAENTEDFTGNIWLMKNGETVLIDTGTGDSWENIRELEKIDKVIITHSHYDHIHNLPKVDDGYLPEIYAFQPENLPIGAEKLEEGDKIDICGSNFKIFHSPGHKDDSICIYSREEKILFTGDLIFPDGGFGRTDLEEGDREKLIESIKKLTGLKVEEMYCGHEEAAKENVGKQIRKSLEEADKQESKY